MPRVSIILPVYNKECYLKDTLDILINQKFTDWELIIINDGSTDNSAYILEQYVAKDKRIKIVSQINKGVSSARNVGLNMAKGEWIWFVDADDIPSIHFLEDVFHDTINNDVDIIIGNYYCINGKKCNRITVDETGFFQSNLVPDLFMKYQYAFGFFGYLWNKIIRKEFINKFNIRFKYGLLLAEDLDFMVSLYMKDANIYLTQYCALKYREDAINSSKEKRIDYITQLELQNKIKNWIVVQNRKNIYIDFFKLILSQYAAYSIFYEYEYQHTFADKVNYILSKDEIVSFLSTKNVDLTMRPIVYGLIKKKNHLIKFYLLSRYYVRYVYRYLMKLLEE